MKRLLIGLSVFLFTTSLFAGTCYVTVTRSNGKAHSGVKVTGSTSAGMTDSTRTNSSGKATLTWSGSGSLQHVYVDGKRMGGCKDGGSFHATNK